MQKWEYVSSINDLEEVGNLDKRLNMGKFEGPLNSKGKEGWELVSVTELRIEGDLLAGSIVSKVAFRKRDCRFLCIWKRPRVHSGDRIVITEDGEMPEGKSC